MAVVIISRTAGFESWLLRRDGRISARLGGGSTMAAQTFSLAVLFRFWLQSSLTLIGTCI